MAFTILDSGADVGGIFANRTVSGLNILGSNGIIAFVTSTSDYTQLDGNITDSEGNSYTSAFYYAGVSTGTVACWYCANPVTSSSHSVSTNITEPATWPELFVFAVSGLDTVDPVNDNTGDTDRTTGSITPSKSGCLLFSSLGTTSSVDPYTIQAPFTTEYVNTYVGGSHYGSGVASVNDYDSVSPIQAVWDMYCSVSAIIAFNPLTSIPGSGGSQFTPSICLVNKTSFIKRNCKWQQNQ